MEILIKIPPGLVGQWNEIKLLCEAAIDLSIEFLRSSYEFLLQQNNALWFFFSLIVFWPIWVYIAIAVTTAWAWFFWLLASALLGIFQAIYVSYQFVMVAVDVMVVTLLKTYRNIMRSTLVTVCLGFFSSTIRRSRQRTSRRKEWRKLCDTAKSYSGFRKLAVLEPKVQTSEDEKAPTAKRRSSRTKRSNSYGNLPALKEETSDALLSASSNPENSPQQLTRVLSFRAPSLAEAANGNVEPNVVQDLGLMTADLLHSTTDRLHEARSLYMYDGDRSLQSLLSGVVKRNHLTLEDLSVNDARSVAYSGEHEFSAPTRELISEYYDEVSKGISSIAEAPATEDDPLSELRERITLVRKMKHNTGRSALMLSGGGAQAMYHLGTIKALIEAGVYDDIKVISGTSGGSISAAMVRREIERIMAC